jgi:hypothetical protein
VKANQEMVMRLTWMREEMRKHVYLELIEVPRGDVIGGLNRFKPVFLPSREVSDGSISAAATASFPKSYLAKAAFEQPGGLDPVFVNWFSTKVGMFS